MSQENTNESTAVASETPKLDAYKALTPTDRAKSINPTTFKDAVEKINEAKTTSKNASAIYAIQNGADPVAVAFILDTDAKYLIKQAFYGGETKTAAKSTFSVSL